MQNQMKNIVQPKCDTERTNSVNMQKFNDGTSSIQYVLFNEYLNTNVER